MRAPKLRTRFVVAAALAALSVTPLRADAQAVFKKIKEQASKRLEQHKAKVDSAVVNTASGTVDSTLEKTSRGADAVVTKVGNVADTTINRTERGVTKALKSVGGGGGGESDRFAAQLAEGRLVLSEIRFADNSDQLEPAAAGVVKQLANALAATSGMFLIEGHTDAMATPEAAQALSQQRAAAVKALLVAEGVPAARLLAVGYGATRLGSGGPAKNARIELTRAQ